MEKCHLCEKEISIYNRDVNGWKNCIECGKMTCFYCTSVIEEHEVMVMHTRLLHTCYGCLAKESEKDELLSSDETEELLISYPFGE